MRLDFGSLPFGRTVGDNRSTLFRTVGDNRSTLFIERLGTTVLHFLSAQGGAGLGKLLVLFDFSNSLFFDPQKQWFQ